MKIFKWKKVLFIFFLPEWKLKEQQVLKLQIYFDSSQQRKKHIFFGKKHFPPPLHSFK
jgi:hypothetical protein